MLYIDIVANKKISHMLKSGLIILLIFFISCGPNNKLEHNTGQKNAESKKEMNNELHDFYEFQRCEGRIFDFYNQFYCTGESSKSFSSMAKFISKSLLVKLQNGNLDYDPFIDGQDWDSNVLCRTLVIKREKNNIFSATFNVDDNVDSKRIIYLTLSYESNVLKIEDVNSLSK